MSSANAFEEGKNQPIETLQEAIDRLTALPAIEYEQCRKEEAEKLGFRASILDKLTDTDSAKQRETSGKKLELKDCEQWHQAVNSDVLNSILNSIQQHMYMAHHDAVICTLWTAHTHMFKDFDHTRRIVITAPAPPPNIKSPPTSKLGRAFLFFNTCFYYIRFFSI